MSELVRSKKKVSRLTRWIKRSVAQIKATAREAGYSVEGDTRDFYLQSKQWHCANYYISLNYSGYFEVFIQTDVWINPVDSFLLDTVVISDDGAETGEPVEIPAIEGHWHKDAWSQCIWSFRNTTGINLLCQTITTSSEYRAKRRN